VLSDYGSLSIPGVFFNGITLIAFKFFKYGHILRFYFSDFFRFADILSSL
jgi:hypothetical protein